MGLVQCLWWKVLHVLSARLMLVVMAEFLNDVYNALQEWDHRQGMFLNCFSHKQLLPRNPNKWQGLSYTLAVIPGSVRGRGCPPLCCAWMGPVAFLPSHCGWNNAKAWNCPRECSYGMELRLYMSWDVVYEIFANLAAILLKDGRECRELITEQMGTANLEQFQPTDFCEHSLEEIVPSTMLILCLREKNLQLTKTG